MDTADTKKKAIQMSSEYVMCILSMVLQLKFDEASFIMTGATVEYVHQCLKM